MMGAAVDERQAHTKLGKPPFRLFVATWPEALPLLRFRPHVVGMGRRAWDLSGCQAVLSAGFAGACQPHLGPGDVIVVATPECSWAAGEERCAPAPSRPIVASLVGGGVAPELRTLDHVASPPEKRALGLGGVAAVDMETAWLAAAATEAGVPFLGVRVVIDRVQDQALSFHTAAHYWRAARALRRAVRHVFTGADA